MLFFCPPEFESLTMPLVREVWGRAKAHVKSVSFLDYLIPAT